jgi:adenine specific DNA methylase Mod
MVESLIELLPKIVAEGKKEAERILNQLSEKDRVTLQTNEYVLPSKEKSGLFRGQIGHIDEKQWLNRMVYGDNLLVMQALLAGDPATGLSSMRGKIDLIYIDPPFDSKADYRTKITLPTGDIEQKPTIIEQYAYGDTWKDGTVSYLKMIYPRLELLKQLLSERGSIYVHLDPNVGHYVKILLDEVFGKQNFHSEIIWRRSNSHNKLEDQYGPIHDNIYFYSKTEKYIFHPGLLPYSRGYIETRFKYKDKRGIYQPNYLTGPGTRSGESGKPWHGFDPTENGRHWAIPSKSIELMGKDVSNLSTQDVLDELNKAELLVIPEKKGGQPMYRQYIQDGIPYQDIWAYQPNTHNTLYKTDNCIDEDVKWLEQEKEKINYDTQKPEGLLKRILITSSEENSIVADFFGGSGSFGAVAEKLNRRWILTDLGKPAVMIMRKRFIDQEAKPFLYQSIGDYQKEQFEKSEFKNISDLAHVVLNLYGAIPFSDVEPTYRNFGFIKESRTLVMVDSPSKLTGYSTLKRAQELRGSFMGGWKKVIVLGWNFVTDIGQVIQNINDEHIEVLVIPPDLLDRLKTKASHKDLIKKGAIRFSSLQYLTIKPVKIREIDKETEEITILLDNYVLLSPDSLPLEDEDKEKLQKVIAKEPLALIEYWSIDPDYDGIVFRSKWQDYRENMENDGDPLRVVKKTSLTVVKIKGNRKICVKTVDVFGFESAVVVEVK